MSLIECSSVAAMSAKHFQPRDQSSIPGLGETQWQVICEQVLGPRLQPTMTSKVKYGQTTFTTGSMGRPSSHSGLIHFFVNIDEVFHTQK